MKNIRYFVFGFILFLLFNIDCYAAPITYERTDSELRVSDKINNMINNDSELKNKIMKIPAVDSKQKIYDFLDIFNEKEELELKNELLDYKKETGIDSVIVITDNIDDFRLSDYAYNFYDYNFFSKEGIVFVIYKKDDKTKIFMGNTGDKESRVFKVYSSNRINAILKYVYEHNIKQGNYLEACKNYNTLTKTLYFKTYGNYMVDDEGNVKYEIRWLECIIIALSLSFIVFVLFLTKYGVNTKIKDSTIKNSINNTDMIVKCEYDKPIGKNEE